MSKFLYIDAETTSLRGTPLAIGVLAVENGEVIDALEIKLADINTGACAPFVQTTILPAISTITETAETAAELIQKYSEFRDKYLGKEYISVNHVGDVVESNLERLAFEYGFNKNGDWDTLPGEFGGIFAPIDVAGLLHMFGEDRSSVDAYNKKHGLEVPFDGAAHHPQYDNWATKVCHEHLMARMTKLLTVEKIFKG